MEKLQRMQEYAEAKVCRRRILLNYFGETSDKGCGNCDVCRTPPSTFDGTELVQKALSAILRTGEQVGFTLTIDILHGNYSPEVVSRGYMQIKTFAAGRDVPVRDWHDYMLQMLQMGYVEIAYNEDNHLRVTPLGKDVLRGKAKVQLVVINREKFSVKDRYKQIQEEQASVVSISGQCENVDLFQRLKILRKEIADEMNSPAFVVMSDKTLHALATDMPTTLSAFGNTFGIGEHKRDTYGERFIEVIKQYAPAKEKNLPNTNVTVTPNIPAEQKEEKKKKTKNQITIRGTIYDIDLDIWESIEWRKVLKDITERAYWNYQGPLEIHLSDYVANNTKQYSLIVNTLCYLLKDGYGMNVDEQTGVVTVAQKYDYDKDGQVVELPSGSFYELLSRFRLFVIQNKRYPFMDGEHDEIALRKWYREVGRGLVTISDDQKILFDNLSTEFADVPKNRGNFEKLAVKKEATLKDNAEVEQEDEGEFEEPDKKKHLSEEEKIGERPIASHKKAISRTIQTTLNLATQGCTFDEIVFKRGLSAYTISKHLSELIQHSLVDVFDFVDYHEYTVISKIVQKLPKGATLNKVKERCPEGIKRNIIRMVMADLKRKQQDKE